MACKACERRNKAIRRKVAADLGRAEKLSAEGRITAAALARARARALKFGLSVVESAASTVGIHGEVEDERHPEDSNTLGKSRPHR